MPDVTDDERGRRIFQLHKERAVETAIEKIRHNPGSKWSAFSPEDIKTLNYILGETWVLSGETNLGTEFFYPTDKKGSGRDHPHRK